MAAAPREAARLAALAFVVGAPPPGAWIPAPDGALLPTPHLPNAAGVPPPSPPLILRI